MYVVKKIMKAVKPALGAYPGPVGLPEIVAGNVVILPCIYHTQVL